MDYAGPSWRVAADGCTVIEAQAAGRPWWTVGDTLPAPVQALVANARREGCAAGPHTLLVEGRPQLWALQAQREADTFALHAMALDWWPEHERERHKAMQDQRDLLIREVHHRIKNNLQALSGLLGRLAREHPALQDPLQRAVAQVRSWGLVYGLHPHRQAQGRAAGLELASLVQAAADSVAELFAARIEIRTLPQVGVEAVSAGLAGSAGAVGPAEPVGSAEPAEPAEPQPAASREPPDDWREQLWAHLEGPAGAGGGAAPGASPWFLGDADATAVALVLNELLINAVKHSRPAGTTVVVNLRSDADGVQADILNRGQWAGAGQADEPGPVGSSGHTRHAPHASRTSQGLGLVQALLPRRGARLEIQNRSPWVCARLHFGPPCVWKPGAAPTQSI